MQDCFLLLFERSLLGQDFRKLRVAGFFIVGVNGFRQKLLELLIELRQPPFDIGKAHGLTLHRQKLQRDHILDPVNQSGFIAHGGVDCCQYRALQRDLPQSGGLVTVFFAVLQAADAAPFVIDISLYISRFAAVERTAFAAEQPVG